MRLLLLEGSVGGDGKTRVVGLLQMLCGMEAQRGRVLFVASPPEGHVESRGADGRNNKSNQREMKAMSIHEAELSRSSGVGGYIIRARIVHYTDYSNIQ